MIDFRFHHVLNIRGTLDNIIQLIKLTEILTFKLTDLTLKSPSLTIKPTDLTIKPPSLTIKPTDLTIKPTDLTIKLTYLIVKLDIARVALENVYHLIGSKCRYETYPIKFHGSKTTILHR